MIECIVVEIVKYQYRVKLRNGLNLAQDLVDSGLAEWLENSVESSFDSLEHYGDKISDEATEWDILNGLPEDILNMTELYAATREGFKELLEDQLGFVPVHHQSLATTQAIPVTPTIPIKLSSTSTIPQDMPSLAIVKGLTNCQSAVPEPGPLDCLPGGDHHLHVVHHPWPGVRMCEGAEADSSVQVLEVDVSGAGELYTLHQIPPLKLYGH